MVTRLLNLDCSYVCGKLQRCLKQKPPAETTRVAIASRRPGWPGICCVVAEAGARREMVVLRSRTTLSQLLLIQLTNTIWDKYTLRWWYCEAKWQNNSVSTAFDQSFAVCNHCNHCTPSISNSSNSTYLYDDEKMRLPENKMLSKTQSCTLFRPGFFNQTRSWPNWLPHRLILLKFHILVFLSKFVNPLWTTLPSKVAVW